MITAILLFIPLPIFSTHYINKTPFEITITNETIKQNLSIRDQEMSQDSYLINLPSDHEVDFDNDQDDEISITSKHSLHDKRKLFPTNNYFNYVITYNKFNPRFEKFDINHADLIDPK